MQTLLPDVPVLGTMFASLPTLLAGGSVVPQGGTAEQVQGAVQGLDRYATVEWIDCIAALALGVFFLLGLMRGFWWQFSKIATLLAAWFLASHYGPDGEAIVNEVFNPAASPAASPPDSTSDLPLFLSYVGIFILTVVVLSILSGLLQKLIEESGLSFYNRIGGAVLGLGTGAIAVIAVLAGIKFLDKNSSIAQAADRSLTMGYTQTTLELPVIKQLVPGWMLARFDIEPQVARKTQDSKTPLPAKAQGSSAGK
ncbi:MAG: CvpA family protein [Planctomycetota bacterium]|nr:CvpA family protein [Planctomycetota bacterium]